MAENVVYEVPVTAELVVQADVGGMQIAFTRVAVEGEVDAWLDSCRKAVNRQRAHQELVEALVDIQARREALASSPDRERAMVKERAAERARLRATFKAQHEASGARVPFAEGKKHHQALDLWDQETEKKRAEFAADRAKVTAELPLYEARAARARAIIAGKDRSEVIGMADPLADAAD